ncbi:hypothetical protein, partial [Eubacterium sp. An11]|uniref:hypothetical protein n=1 Tax=Eubacterium sp. An11 TaxID=1965542 RepID=UPI00194FFBF9
AGELPEIRKRRSEIEIGANLSLSYRFAPDLYRYEISTVYGTTVLGKSIVSGLLNPKRHIFSTGDFC